MSTKLSVEEVLSSLEARAAFHREQEALHAEQEAHHGTQRSLHAAELAKVLQNLESFRAAASTAVDLAREHSERQTPPREEPPPEVDLPSSGRLLGSRLVKRVVERWSGDEPFGPTAVAAEVNRLYRSKLKKPLGQRAASDVLRRLTMEGRLHLVRPGKAFHQALYARGARPR